MKHLLFLGIAFGAFLICHSDVPAFCDLPEDKGTGERDTFLFFFEKPANKCSLFVYGGQGGNANRFANERECIRNCSTYAEGIYPMDARKACHFKKAVGTCGNSHLRYYYDSIHDKCKKFLWSGCGGNGNRFTDIDVCNATCFGVHDDGDEPEEDEPDTPIAIICGVLLAVIVVAIVITVVVLTVQSKKKSSKKKGGKSKEARVETPLQERTIEVE